MKLQGQLVPAELREGWEGDCVKFIW